MTEYLKKVAQHLDEESHRVESYLHPSTLASLIKKVEEILIYDQLEAIYTEVKTLLHNEKYSDLALLFKLVARVPNVTVKSKNIVEDHFCLMGIEAIRRIGKTVINVKNPKLYVETILDNHIEFFKLVRCFLNNDQHFIAALNKTCGNFY
ncbi:unnamed protein product [Rotaria sordida]|uniref:Cullin N-terminal domain-containing protein n=1 Tax=Rotaria sordida TaxID=392033 RepID=A0A814V4N0_9BILA|nr:unnamed protein product [Rotaria sordida]CAF4135731.1 unnamed protein product [Rotaria sordida]